MLNESRIGPPQQRSIGKSPIPLKFHLPKKIYSLARIAAIGKSNNQYWPALEALSEIVALCEVKPCGRAAFFADLEIARAMYDSGGFENFDPTIEQMHTQSQHIFAVYNVYQAEIVVAQIKIGQEYGYHFDKNPDYIQQALLAADQVDRIVLEMNRGRYKPEETFATMSPIDRTEFTAFCTARAREIRENATTALKNKD